MTADADEMSVPDPMGMGGFCGADINAYVDRWLALGARLKRPPKLFQVNWFLRGVDGSLLWPALSEGWRIVNWIAARVAGLAEGRMTCAGLAPAIGELERTGLVLPDDAWQAMLSVTPTEWGRELDFHGRLLETLGRSLPLEIHRENRVQRERLGATLSQRGTAPAGASLEKPR
jgi:phosphoenolpyruvate carboxykinase (GTP)